MYMLRNLEKINVDDYEPVNKQHYNLMETKYFHDWEVYSVRNGRAIISIEGVNRQIEEREREFREWYFIAFLNDSTKVRKK